MAIIFTYGSLMCEDIMTAVTGQKLAFDEARLIGYERYAVRGEAYPAIIPKTASSVQGRVYYGVNEQGLARLDSFEGDYYQRILLKVNVLDRPLDAHSYVFRDEYRGLLADWRWDFEYFLQYGKQKFTSQYLGYRRLV
ncbi:gamma-glutamylcyclotransferase family protein [Zhongshania aliphaticivorans]|uniref:gamma-glutamylcyclotransferase family protein n=1 Tax=Zhongshania aliphaticivorans TaxID=1470434 RepID=UPI0012E58C85|nr:gamma-glutamylcyclotransferase family protein [Zhongshania aliphaticivorans]CAA0081482.1 Uncharacterised protein [Zhongshania aliphaticivorans]